LVSQSPSLDPWVIDSNATSHISSNCSLFSSFTTAANLPLLTTTNGSQTQVCSIGIIQPLSSLIVDNVLHVPHWPFNLLFITQFHNIILTFTKNNATLQDRISSKAIGVECESQGLYYLSPSPLVCSSTVSPMMIQAQ